MDDEYQLRLADISSRISQAWSLILKQYGKMAQEKSREYGPGINIFLMLAKPKDGIFNCDYRYLSSSNQVAFESFLKSSKLYFDIIREYKPEENFLASVHIQLDDKETVGDIRVLSYDTFTQII